MNRVFSLVLLFVASSVLFAVSANHVPNLQNPQKNIFTAGQPTREGFQELASIGIRTVINVLPEQCCIEEEPSFVIQSGMTYRSVPFDPQKFRKETVEYFAHILKNARKPVLIHCSTGHHAAGIWFAYRILHEDARLEEALMEARMIGLKQESEEELIAAVIKANTNH